MNKRYGNYYLTFVVVVWAALLLAAQAQIGYVFAGEATPVVETVVAAKSSLPSWVDELVLLAIMLLGGTVLLFVSFAVRRLGKKFGLENTKFLEDLAVDAARKGINYAERWAKKKDLESTPDGPAKLEKAIDRILEIEGRVGAGDMIRDAISKRIHTELESGN